MESLNKLEKTVAGWLKPLPHLPEKAQKWIAINIWWLELIGLIIMVFFGFALIGLLMVALGITVATVGAFGYHYSYTGITIFATFLSLLLMVISVAVMAFAIIPLKALKKRGWDFLFIAILINCVSTILSAVLSFSPSTFLSSLFSGAVGILVSTYLLFEIRSYFVAVKTVKAKK